MCRARSTGSIGTQQPARIVPPLPWKQSKQPEFHALLHRRKNAQARFVHGNKVAKVSCNRSHRQIPYCQPATCDCRQLTRQDGSLNPPRRVHFVLHGTIYTSANGSVSDLGDQDTRTNKETGAGRRSDHQAETSQKVLRRGEPGNPLRLAVVAYLVEVKAWTTTKTSSTRAQERDVNRPLQSHKTCHGETGRHHAHRHGISLAILRLNHPCPGRSQAGQYLGNDGMTGDGPEKAIWIQNNSLFRCLESRDELHESLSACQGRREVICEIHIVAGLRNVAPSSFNRRGRRDRVSQLRCVAALDQASSLSCALPAAAVLGGLAVSFVGRGG